MKRYVAFAVLAASLLAGCGTSPALQTKTTFTGKAAAASLEAEGQIQIHDAFQRVEASKQLRVVVLYWVRHEGKDREFRQIILDSMPTQDRSVYRSGYRPMQMLANGKNMLNDDATMLKIARELGELNYHTVSKDQQKAVSLAYEIVMDHVH